MFLDWLIRFFPEIYTILVILLFIGGAKLYYSRKEGNLPKHALVNREGNEN
jgi:hypothetical protein